MKKVTFFAEGGTVYIGTDTEVTHVCSTDEPDLTQTVRNLGSTDETSILDAIKDGKVFDSEIDDDKFKSAFELHKNEALSAQILAFLEGTLSVKITGFDDAKKIYTVVINGKNYGYKELEGGTAFADVVAKFEKMMKFAPGKALSYLKKNSSKDVVGAKAK